MRQLNWAFIPLPCTWHCPVGVSSHLPVALWETATSRALSLSGVRRPRSTASVGHPRVKVKVGSGLKRQVCLPPPTFVAALSVADCCRRCVLCPKELWSAASGTFGRWQGIRLVQWLSRTIFRGEIRPNLSGLKNLPKIPKYFHSKIMLCFKKNRTKKMTKKSLDVAVRAYNLNSPTLAGNFADVYRTRFVNESHRMIQTSSRPESGRHPRQETPSVYESALSDHSSSSVSFRCCSADRLITSTLLYLYNVLKKNLLSFR